MKRLLKYLRDHHGYDAENPSNQEIHEEAARLIKAGEMSLDKFTELTVTKDTDAAYDRLLKTVKAAVTGEDELPDFDEEAIERTAGSLKTVKAGDEDSSSFFAGGQPRVKAAAERYEDSAKAAYYPDWHWKSGQPIMFDGRHLEYPSELSKAYCGAHLKTHFAKQLGWANRVSDHDKQLFQEGLRKAAWSGDVPHGSQVMVYSNMKLMPQHVKTVFSDSTSGGENLIQQVLEDQIVMNLLLYGEITPYVDMKSMAKGNSVDTASMVHMTISSGPEESSSAITPQSTTSLISKVNSPVFTATGAIELGRDFLSDITPQVMPSITDSYKKQLQVWLDNQICNGDGTTEPLGLFVISGPTSVASLNGSTGVFAVIDVENMMKTLGKQYRANKNPAVRWVSNDTTYWRLRGIPVSTSDARRIFGQSYEDYQLAGRPYSVQNDIGNTKLGFGDLSNYRLWSRPGMEMQVEQSGRTLVLANSVLVVLRSRWAGRLILTESFVKMTTAPR